MSFRFQNQFLKISNIILLARLVVSSIKSPRSALGIKSVLLFGLYPVKTSMQAKNEYRL